MPFVKVPGFEREIWFDLLETEQDSSEPLLVTVAELVELSPEQFASELAGPSSDWCFSSPHETAFKASRSDAEAMKVSVRNFEPLLRSARAKQDGVGTGGRGRGGRPASTIFAAADDVSVIAIHFMPVSYTHLTLPTIYSV